MKKSYYALLLITVSLVITCATETQETNTELKAPSIRFHSASSIGEVRSQIDKLPTEDIWWNVYGTDQQWNFKNLHRIYPTVNVYREGQVSILKDRRMPQIANQQVETPAGKMPFEAFIDSDQSTTMGLVILQKGEVVYEYYPRQEPYEKPIFWSVTKVFVSALVGILEDRGQVDVGLPISTYLPELMNSDFKDITVRNILDMASGVNCQENYEDWKSCYYQYSATIGDGFWSEDGPKSPYEFLASVKPGFSQEQGTQFEYSGVNTFLLSWLVEKQMDMPFQDALTKEIWRKIGAEADASILAPRYGVANTHGGLLARLRDVARFGMLYTPSSDLLTDEQIVSDRVLKVIRDEGNPKLWEKAREKGWLPSDFSHSAYQWDQVYQNHDFYKGGWCGQGLLVNPDKDIVAVYTGYCQDAGSSEVDLLPILRQVLKEVFPPSEQ
jgi:CubicO group peptidase (beta-lactamase class C family)